MNRLSIAYLLASDPVLWRHWDRIEGEDAEGDR